MREVDLAWVSGIFEGEGHINIRARGRGRRGTDFSSGPRYEVSIHVGMTDEDVILSLQSKTGVGSVKKQHPPSHQARDNKPIYRWSVTKRSDVISVLEIMLPYLHSRRSEKALEALMRAKEAEIDYSIHSTSPGAIATRKYRLKATGPKTP